MNEPRVWRPNWDAFAEWAEGIRREHEARNEAEAVARSLAAFNRWGVQPPRDFPKHAAVVAADRARDNSTPDEVHA